MQQEQAVVKAIQKIIKKNKKLRSLTPPKGIALGNSFFI